MTVDTRQLATKEDLLHVQEDLLHAIQEDLRQMKEELRAELRHFATKADLWRAIAFQTIAFTGIVAAITRL